MAFAPVLFYDVCFIEHFILNKVLYDNPFVPVCPLQLVSGVAKTSGNLRITAGIYCLKFGLLVSRGLLQVSLFLWFYDL